jgi:curved DNA-binding protein CbpA
MKSVDYYEFLQISPNAEEDTIHRVFRFLASRFHPDNPESGNAEKFAMLSEAYEILSHPARRAKYDSNREREVPEVVPLSNSVDFMDQLQGETNRRLAVLAVLYFRRRSNPHAPQVSLAEVETRMGFPRDYLDFTTWYLQKKGYITKADNSDFTLTADGVDFVETQRVNIPVLNKLLTSGSENSVSAPASGNGFHTNGNGNSAAAHSSNGHTTTALDRRLNTKDRRSGNPDWRAVPTERRVNTKDRRKEKGLAQKVSEPQA